ncbi:E3 ubiquitin-protein ligase RNF13 [Lasiodiplodia hormozganensis]|uniref:E3 ubiquitin-protein ligase RNF13 n=1 Tax=Lasiodiplodia hormozganensis TaxID=869390 RepID=A0AA39Z5D6_9PEZI|nr:E3 ubiquitin-protein ligase RNF13 [Lasiodiplodia hormozganensis]
MPATVLMRYVRTTCAAAVAVAAAVSAQTVTPSNATDQLASSNRLELFVTRGTVEGVPVAQVVPLTARAADDLSASTGLPAQQLFYATESTAQRLNNSNIAYINCDPDAYRGNLQASNVLDTTIERGATAALFFSTSARSCNVTGVSDDFPYLYSMVNATTSQQILDDLRATTSEGNQLYFVTIRSTGESNGNDTMSTANSDTGSDQNQSSSNPLGPSPSTAVAMIILYSITGVITALFLIIIITGALRAHRHPERYGPGVVLNGGRGTSRQTRVRGIARAMLDTLPVVKFGDNTNQQHPPKPTDVEMGDTTARNSAEDMQQSREAESGAPGPGATGGAGVAAPNSRNSHEGAPRPAAAGPTNDTEQQRHADATEAGIAPAAAGGSAENLASEGDAYTGCTICTEEFEPGQDVRVLPCNHKFHPECIDPWLLNVSGTCPLCRIDLNPASPTDEHHPDSEHHHSNSATTRRSASILAPPLSPMDAAAANIPSSPQHHRRSVFRDLLHLRGHEAASSQERLAMARRMAGNRNSREANATATTASGEVGDERRRSRRLSTLFRRERHSAAPTDVEEGLPRPPPPVHERSPTGDGDATPR